MSKSRDAFRTISEVSDLLDTPAHVLRFWESKFAQVKPVKRAGGRRYYRPTDVELLAGIKKLLHDDGMTIKGAQKLLREQGVKHVGAIGAEVLKENAEAVEAPVEATSAVAVEPVVEAPVAPQPEVDITNVVPLPGTPETGPALTLNLAPKAEPATETETPVEPAVKTATHFPSDPADSDSKANARLFHLLHKAESAKLQAQAQAIAPLLDRMQVLRDRINLR